MRAQEVRHVYTKEFFLVNMGKTGRIGPGACTAFIIPTTLLLCGLVFNVIAVGSDMWVSGSTMMGGVNVSYSGLWRQCSPNGSVGVQCTVRGFPVEPWILAVRTLSVVALILAPLGTGAAAVNSLIPKLSGFAACCGAVSTLTLQFGCFGAAMAIYTVNAYNRDFQAQLGWSYILGWVGVALYGAATAAFALQGVVFACVNRERRQATPSYLEENLLQQ